MTMRGCLRLLLGVLSICLVASASFAGTVSGTITNGTTGKPAVGVDVILIQLQGTMQPVATTKTDSAGHYKIDNPALGAGPMLLRAVYRGVNYHEPITPGKTTADIQVFEPTDKPDAFTVTAHAIILQPTGTDLGVTEEYVLSNKTQPPVAFYRADGSFVFSLPKDAQLGNISAAGSAGMPVVQTAIDKGQGQQAIVFPFRPGDSEVTLSYRVPYPSNQTTIRVVSHYKADRVAILAPPTVKISSSGFNPSGQEQGFSVYMMNAPLAADAPVSASISGTAPPPAPDNGAAASTAGGDDSQNPSVNSRIETGNTAPVASVTTLPARIDGLKWYVVAGFAALFALGLVYLWRQPQPSLAGASADSGRDSGDRHDVEFHQGTTSAAPIAGFRQGTASAVPTAPPNIPGASAPEGSARVPGTRDLDREVRGSLDELKDTLFRLELRREAGTIGEEDYLRERDRVQKVLRNQVKG